MRKNEHSAHCETRQAASLYPFMMRSLTPQTKATGPPLGIAKTKTELRRLSVGYTQSRVACTYAMDGNRPMMLNPMPKTSIGLNARLNSCLYPRAAKAALSLAKLPPSVEWRSFSGTSETSTVDGVVCPLPVRRDIARQCRAAVLARMSPSYLKLVEL